MGIGYFFSLLLKPARPISPGPKRNGVAGMGTVETVTLDIVASRSGWFVSPIQSATGVFGPMPEKTRNGTLRNAALIGLRRRP